MPDVGHCRRRELRRPRAKRQSNSSDADRFFFDKVQPLLASRCATCHGPDKAEGGLRLDSREAALKGGDSGPALVPGKPDESLLLMAVKRTHEVLEMPPKEKLSGEGHRRRWNAGYTTVLRGPRHRHRPAMHPLPGEHIGDAWTDPRNPIVRLFGGQRLDLWSLKPVERPDCADGEAQAIGQRATSIDSSSRGSSRMACRRHQPADPRTLARRLYYDLTGLPPTPRASGRFREIRASNVGPTRPSPRSSTNCSPARASASTSRGSGSTWSATATATASIGTSFARRPGDFATTSSARSTPTSPSISSFASSLPATNCWKARPRRRPSRTA